jgi:hypothetical protein
MRHEQVEFIPEVLEEGVLYISQEFETSTHLCACGCKTEVVLPITQAGWSLKVDNDMVTLHPSIGNRFACKSHYWIRNGEVVWASKRKNG